MITVVYKFNEQQSYIQWYSMNAKHSSSNNGMDVRPRVWTQQILDFLEVTHDLQLRTVMIDPLVLYQTLDYRDKQILLVNDLLSKSLLNDIVSNREYCIAFGVFRDQIPVLKTKLGPKLRDDMSYKETLIEGIDGSQRQYNNTSSDDLSDVLLHAFYTKDGECLQISVFHPRHQFLWMGAIPIPTAPAVLLNNTDTIDSDNSFPMPKDYHYGKHEMAFDMFTIDADNTTSAGGSGDGIYDLWVPDDRVHYLAQLETGQFVECNYRVARDYAANYPAYLTDDQNMDQSVKDALVSLKTMARQLHIPIFISSGTLLGWYRQCSVIPYTSDLDTATWARYATDQATDQWLHNKVGFRLTYIYGLLDNGYQYAFYTSRDDLRVDLFYMYEEWPNLTYTGHLPSKHMYFRYWYPWFRLCSAELVGLKVLVPCTAEAVVRAEYGPEWYKPETEWSYLLSAYNIGPYRYWSTDEEALRAYKKFT
ncbi:ribitol-5-phosphate transferase FKTN-like [Oppia nitens]|uniref:ribitol-5-phosphate transferase FKTN-like n=1 Tax=Oppia nitens TaxID=1686743 RepID=UPI0023D9F788|nr:ribitol-5-phosphate transferase FKTN-like [Oppia nitens]